MCGHGSLHLPFLFFCNQSGSSRLPCRLVLIFDLYLRNVKIYVMDRFKQLYAILLVVITFGLPISGMCAEEDLPKNFPFDEKTSLDEWEEKIFKNKVLYTIEEEPVDGYLSAVSNAACSGLIYKVKFSVEKYPMISWSWKVTKFPDKLSTDPAEVASATIDDDIKKIKKSPKTSKKKKSEKEGWIEQDDYAARVYVIFPSIIFTDTKCIEYVWDETLPLGTVMTSPFFKNIKIIVAESGRENLNKWVFEEQNIADDYLKAFGKEVSRRVGAISLMTDTDNTLSTAEAFYKDIKIRFKAQKPEETNGETNERTEE
jgi:Protein of unknown function (DUF3047)